VPVWNKGHMPDGNVSGNITGGVRITNTCVGTFGSSDIFSVRPYISGTFDQIGVKFYS